MSRKLSRTLVGLIIIISLIAVRWNLITVVKVSGQPVVPYNVGNWTYISRPIYPMEINETQIQVGENWTYVINLNAGSAYHVYFYGEWIEDTPLINKTDYDIFVYNPFGELESMHTESAGLPEHLGTTVEDPFFIPEYSGNYSFLICNDAKESKGDHAGILMIIEHLETNQWYELYLRGKVNNVAVRETYWAYEFVTLSEEVEILVDVPDTLDMYEVQLYLMANPSQGMGSILNGVPLPWDRGLYGETDPTSTYGGYRLDAEGFSHANASASCEYFGQDMKISYTSPAGSIFLYHLSLIAETGEGVVRFMFKTDFEAPSLEIQNPVEKATSGEETLITAQVSGEEFGLESVLLEYTVDDWETKIILDMLVDQNYTCTATIPGQPAGSTVKYKVIATDTAGNVAEEEGSYVVKDSTVVTISLSKPILSGGETLKVNGWVSQSSVTVILEYVCQDLHISRTTTANATGYFSDEYTPERSGDWTVFARWEGDEEYFGAFSSYLNLKVEKASPSITCSLDRNTIGIGEYVEIAGSVYPVLEYLRISLVFTQPNGTKIERYVYTSTDGSFNLVFQPDTPGVWRVQAKIVEDALTYPSSSNALSIAVNDSWLNQYKLYIIASAGVAAVLIFIIFLRSRKNEEFEG